MTTRAANAARRGVSGRRSRPNEGRGARWAFLAARRSNRGFAATLVLALAAGLAPTTADPWAGVTLCVQPGEEDGVRAARAVVARARSVYEGARTYEDSAIIRHSSSPASIEHAPQVHETRVELRFARPNRIALRSDQGGVYCDGATLWLHNAATHEYTESPAPPALSLHDLDRLLPAAHLALHPLGAALAAGDPIPSLLSPNVQGLLGAWAEERAGEPGYRVQAVGWGDVPSSEPSPVTLRFDGRSGLLEEMSIDMSGARRGALAHLNTGFAAERSPASRRDILTLTARVVGARIDEGIPPEAFVFTPGPLDRRVGEFGDPGEPWDSRQRAMIGRPVPEVSGVTLAGHPWSTADLKGGVSVLVFWDTWCGSCVDAVAAMQRLSDRFAGQPVTVVGINQDSSGGGDRVGQLLEERRIMFEQLPDADNSIARSFSFTGLPGTVLLDREGTVQKFSTGFADGQEESLERDIRALLAGRDLRVPTELAEKPGAR